MNILTAISNASYWVKVPVLILLLLGLFVINLNPLPPKPIADPPNIEKPAAIRKVTKTPGDKSPLAVKTAGSSKQLPTKKDGSPKEKPTSGPSTWPWPFTTTPDRGLHR